MNLLFLLFVFYSFELIAQVSVTPRQMDLLIKDAENGDAKKQGQVAYLLQKEDPRKAVYWYIKACENIKPDRTALLEYGTELVDPKELKGWVNRSPEKGMNYLKKAAELGEPSACLRIGLFYSFGLVGIEKDFEQGELYLEKAKRLGAPGASEALLKLRSEMKSPTTSP